MKKFKGTKKILALLLALSLITGMMPATAWNAFAAAEKTPIDAAIIFTDLHTNKSDYKDESGEAIQNIFGALKTTGLPFSSVTSGGDAFSVNKDNDSTNGKYTGYTKTISTAIRNALGNTKIPVNYVWSDHDRYAVQEDNETLLDKTSHVSYGAGTDGIIGTPDDGNYYVYSLSMGDLSSFDRYSAGFSSNRTKNGFTESIEKAIGNFETDVAKMDKTKPLLIVSHQPLFDRRDDNAFAEAWFDAINTVAASMDVAFFFGHNHKYDQANDYYYAKGSKMPVATKDKWSSYAVGKDSCGVDLSSENKTLNFTHMCAGYMEPTSTGSYSKTGTRRDVAMAVTIYEDSIQYTTYDKNGVYTGNYAVNETVTRAYAAKPAKKELASISVTTHPTKTTYTVGEAFDKTGMVVTASYSDNSTASVTGYTVTTDDMSTAGTKEVTVTYTEGSVTKTATFNIVVEAADTPVVPDSPTVPDEETSGNDFPAYPNPGSVELYKTATPLDQNTGLTRVDLSTSGLPASKGVDVIVMLDTSSSMDKCIVCNKYVAKYTTDKTKQCSCSNDKKKITTRVDELIEALKELESSLKSASNPENIRVAIADFNGMYTDGPCATDNNDDTADKGGLTDKGVTQVFTGDRSGYDMSAFITANNLDVEKNIQPLFTTTSAQTGTNYDYGFDAIYQLGNALKEENEKNGEERQLFVLFMSDGAPNQYNFYRSTGGDSGSKYWNYWLQGTAGVGSNPNLNTICDCDKHTYYYDETNGNQHRMANAIKGSSSSQYNIIRKSDDGLENLLKGQNPTDNIYSVPGLDAKMYSIAFRVTADGTVTEDSARKVLTEIASSEEMYINAENAEDLAKAFHNIGTEIAYAATNAVFTDIMGDDFKLQLGTTVKSNAAGKDGEETVDTAIIVKTENVYIPSQVGTTVLGHTVTNADVGKPYGDVTELERVIFNEDGTKAYSNKIDLDNDGIYGAGLDNGKYVIKDTDDNILQDKIIRAKNFVYNTNTTSKDLTLENDDPIKLGPDEFYWTIGTINQKRYTLSYMAYLKGSMEGTREAGSYKTNNLAKLSYTNWLGNDVSQTVPSPVVGWGKAQVSYAFYLVNDDGQPLYADGTIAPNFEKAYKVTRPVVYDTVNLNNSDAVVSTVGQDVLPTGYTLYDIDAKYTVKPQSGDGEGSYWRIENGGGTTYVTGYAGASDYTNEMYKDDISYAYTDTTVYFAVKWSIKAVPDTVVVDYGLPVDISVLANDMFGGKGELAGVGSVQNIDFDSHTKEIRGFANSYSDENNQLKYGTAVVNGTNKVRYTPTNMQMNGYDKFAYAVNYTGDTNPGYYYGEVTVIPATTIYYEDSFLEYSATNTEWVDEGTEIAGAVQDEDRPGEFSLNDADNIYGYDSVNKGMSTFSLGTAKKVHVDADSYATAEFTFYGTGFDIIGMTSNTTGTIAVKITDVNGNPVSYADGTPVTNKVVNTYYGYNVVDGEWVPAPDEENALYQVPVMQAENLPYGNYKVTITATYATFLDQTTAAGYDLYIDAIRIYDPANDGASDGTADKTIEDAYLADGEGWPSYIELRNKLIPANSFDNVANNVLSEPMDGLIFIDGDASVGDAQIEDYKNYGPNNEVYLAPGQSVAFMLDDVTKTEVDENGNEITESIVKNVHIGIKSADGKKGTYTITNLAGKANPNKNIVAGQYYNEKTASMDTTTDMYYNLTGYKGDIIVITNTGNRYGTEGVISLTNIKSTYTCDPSTITPSVEPSDEDNPIDEVSVYMTPGAAKLTLRSLNNPVVPEEPETPIDPDTPVVPEDPETPDIPVTPEEPDTPVTPEDPETPVVPENPVEPEEPETPPVVEEPEEPVAAPAKIISLKTDKQNYVQGDKVKVTVTTNKEATKVKVGTKVLKNYTTKNGNRTWTTTVNATKLGKLTIGAIAYNSKGTATKKVTKVVTVKKFAPRIFNVTLNKYKVKKGQKYTVTVKAGSSVKHVRVNGKKITKFTTKNGVKTFKVTFKANKVGKQKVKVIAYNKALYPTNPKVKTITVTRK